MKIVHSVARLFFCPLNHCVFTSSINWLLIFYSSRMSSLSVETNRSDYDQELYHRLRMNVSIYELHTHTLFFDVGQMSDLLLFVISVGNGFHGFAWSQFRLCRSRRLVSTIARTLSSLSCYIDVLNLKIVCLLFSVTVKNTTGLKRPQSKWNKIKDLAVTTVRRKVYRVLLVSP